MTERLGIFQPGLAAHLLEGLLELMRPWCHKTQTVLVREQEVSGTVDLSGERGCLPTLTAVSREGLSARGNLISFAVAIKSLGKRMLGLSEYIIIQRQVKDNSVPWEKAFCFPLHQLLWSWRPQTHWTTENEKIHMGPSHPHLLFRHLQGNEAKRGAGIYLGQSAMLLMGQGPGLRSPDPRISLLSSSDQTD